MRCRGNLPHFQEPLQLDEGWAGRYARLLRQKLVPKKREGGRVAKALINKAVPLLTVITVATKNTYVKKSPGKLNRGDAVSKALPYLNTTVC